MPEPALTVPEKVTSLAVIVMAAFVEEMDLVAALVTLPVPLVTIVVEVPPPKLAFTATAPLLVVVSVTEPPEVTVTGEEIVNVLALVMLTVVLPPVTAPELMVPRDVTFSVLVPSVIVCPVEV